MPSSLQKLGSRIFIYLVAFVIFFALVVAIIFGVQMQSLIRQSSRAFDEVDGEMVIVTQDIFNEEYDTFMEDILFNLTNQNYEIQIFTKDEYEEQNKLNIINSESNVVDSFETNLNPNLNFNNFVVGNTNRLAYVSARAVAESPGKIHNPLFIYGKSGLGKTHLMHAIGNYIVENSDKKVLYATCEDFMTDYTGIADLSRNSNSLEYANEFKNKYRNVDVLIIDDIQ